MAECHFDSAYRKRQRWKNEKGFGLHIAGNEEGHFEFASGWREKDLLFALMSG